MTVQFRLVPSSKMREAVLHDVMVKHRSNLTGRLGGSNSDGGEIFHGPPDQPWGTPVSRTMGTGSLSPGVKQPGRGIDRPPLSRA